jgi:hypothetical protein
MAAGQPGLGSDTRPASPVRAGRAHRARGIGGGARRRLAPGGFDALANC